MEVEGTIFLMLPRLAYGNEGKEKQGYVLLTEGNNPHYFYFEIADGKSGNLARYNIQQGKKYKVLFDIRASEWKGKWYNHVNVSDVREVFEADGTQKQAR